MGKGFTHLTTYCRHFIIITSHQLNQLMLLKCSENQEFVNGFERNERDTSAKPLKFPFLANWLSIRTILPVLPCPPPFLGLGEATIRSQNDLEDAVVVSKEGVGANC